VAGWAAVEGVWCARVGVREWGVDHDVVDVAAELMRHVDGRTVLEEELRNLDVPVACRHQQGPFVRHVDFELAAHRIVGRDVRNVPARTVALQDAAKGIDVIVDHGACRRERPRGGERAGHVSGLERARHPRKSATTSGSSLGSTVGGSTRGTGATGGGGGGSHFPADKRS
jgi:uncharacterized membrane protein YgcG